MTSPSPPLGYTLPSKVSAYVQDKVVIGKAKRIDSLCDYDLLNNRHGGPGGRTPDRKTWRLGGGPGMKVCGSYDGLYGGLCV